MVAHVVSDAAEIALALPGPGAAPWIALVSIGAAGAFVVRRALDRRSVQRRLGEAAERRAIEEPITPADVVEPFDSRLDEWLVVAGYRSPRAPAIFLWAQAAAVAVGAAIAIAVSQSGLVEVGRVWLEDVPGGIGTLLAPVITLAAWILFVLIALLPVTVVRRSRRERVASVERDLPVALGLLATLVESGVGFDAALDRVREAMPDDRPLAEEISTFRAEQRGGVPRIVSFQRLARRLDVSAVSVFVSAMIHAEHVGASVAETLRRQASEVWSRRRERAIQRAQTLPTRLAFPLVICFLPGIFVWTFGPAISEFIRIAESVLENR